MAANIATTLGIGLTTAGMHQIVSKYEPPENLAQKIKNAGLSGFVSGISITPFYFAGYVFKASKAQFPAEKSLVSALTKYWIADLGHHWARYATLQGCFALQGAGLGLLGYGISHLLSKKSDVLD